MVFGLYAANVWFQIQGHDSEEEPLSSQRQYGEMEEPLVCGETIPSRYYSLDRRIELGEMANLFLNKSGRTMFYVILCVYLYGDLSIYSAAVAKTVMDIIWWVSCFFSNTGCPTVMRHEGKVHYIHIKKFTERDFSIFWFDFKKKMRCIQRFLHYRQSELGIEPAKCKKNLLFYYFF